MTDVRRIAFVSEHYLELQGLIPAAFGGAVLLASVTEQAFGGLDATQVMLFGMLGGAVPGGMFLQRSYRRTFGTVVSNWRQKASAALQTSIVSTGMVIDLFRAFHSRGNLPSVAALALAVYSAALVVRDWRWRPHYVVGIAAGLAGAYVTTVLGGVPDRFGLDPVGAAGYLLAYTFIGLALVITGLFDHRLLVSAMRPAVAAAPRPRSAQSLAIVRTLVAGVLCCAAGAALQLQGRWVAVWFHLLTAVALFALFLIFAVLQVVRGLRDFPRNVREAATPELRVDRAASIAVAVVALAATVQAVLLPYRPPTVLTGAVALASAWRAVSDWRDRRAYFVVSVAAVAVMPLVASADPARGFLLSVFAIAAGFVAHGLAAWWRSFAADSANAHTV